VAYTLAMVVVMWRYLKEQRELYLYLVPLILMLGFTTMEMTFITTAIFLVYLEFQLASDLLDQYRASRTLTPPETMATYAVFLIFGWLLALTWPLIEGARKRWSLETMPAAGNFLVVMVVFALPQFAPVIQKIPLLHLGTSNTYDVGTAHQSLKIITTLAFLFIAAYIGLFWNWRIFLVGAAIFYIPFVLLYTTFFTNPGGFWTGIWGSLDYWLSQQLVRRGSQPDYYYLMMAPIYEFLPLVFALGGALYYAFKGKRDQILLSASILLLVLVFSLIPGKAPIIGSWWKLSFIVAIGGVMMLQMESFTKFLLFWSLSSIFALTVAGEKMPWLIVHVSLPLVLLAAKIVDDILSNVGQAVQAGPEAESKAKKKRAVSNAVEQQQTSLAPPGLDRYLPILYGSAMALVAAIVFQAVGPASPLSVIAWILSLGAAGVVAWMARSGSWRTAGQVAALALFSTLFVFTVRAGVIAAYDQGTVGSYPQEALIYAQGSPALNVLRDDITHVSEASGEGTDLPVVIDQTGNIWPWPWIMRNHRGYQSSTFGDSFTPPPNSVVFVSTQNQANMQPYLDQYSDGIPYTHMWWFPEYYQRLTREHFLSDVFGGQLLGTWRRYFIDREVRGATAAPDMIAYFPKSFKPPVVPPSTGGIVGADQLPASAVTTIGGPGAGPKQFSAPLDLSVDAQGNLYVVDSLNHRIQRIAPDGTTQVAGQQGSGKGQFANPKSADYNINDGPWGIGVDAQGNIYVADTWNHRIQKFGPDLKYILDWGTGQLFGPRDVAIDAQGNVLVVDTGNKRIEKYNSDGKLIQEYGKSGGGNGDFNEPSSVSIAPNGDIFVADYWNRRIQRFNASFQYISQIKVDSWGSPGITDRAYIVAMPDGRILATDPANSRIIVFDAQGNQERSWRLPGTGSRPVGIAFDPASQQVYISDSLANAVVKIPLSVLLTAPPPPATSTATSVATAATAATP
jgi:uncharacterized protein (TIGR03663 family)